MSDVDPRGQDGSHLANPRSQADRLCELGGSPLAGLQPRLSPPSAAEFCLCQPGRLWADRVGNRDVFVNHPALNAHRMLLSLSHFPCAV